MAGDRDRSGTHGIPEAAGGRPEVRKEAPVTEEPSSPPADTFDGIAHDLQELRLASGAPSYADIVVRISQDRRARGIDPARSRPARSTVYDAFRPGRSRINAALVGEIATALGAEDPDSWVRRCQRARRAVDRPRAAGRVHTEPVNSTDAPARAAREAGREPSAPQASTSPDPATASAAAAGPPSAPTVDHSTDRHSGAAVAEQQGADADATPRGTAPPRLGQSGTMQPSGPAAPTPEAAADSATSPMPPTAPGAGADISPSDEPAPTGRPAASTIDDLTDAAPEEAGSSRTDPAVEAELDELATEPALAEPTAGQRWGFLAFCIAVNIAGTLLLKLVHLPLHLDMVGTGAAAILLGPWWGVLVGALTTVIQIGINSWGQLPFGLVAVAGALVWGYGAQRFGMLRGIPRFLSLNLLVAVVCTAIAVPVILTIAPWGAFHSDTIHGELLDRISDHGLATLVRNLTVSVADKMFSGLLIATILLSVSWAPPSRRPSLTERTHPTSPSARRRDR